MDTASLFATAIKNAAPAAHLADFAEAAVASPHPPRDADLLAEPPSSWADALRRLEIMARSEPLVVVLDEYPWAAAADPTLDSRIQVAWDRGLERLPVLLVLLYGRARPFLVDPLTPRDTADLVTGPGGAGAVAALDVHLVTGGYPRLVRAASEAGGAEELVRAAVADPFSELVVSAQLTLDAELPPPVSARAVLEAIGEDSRGPAVFGLIADRLPRREGAAGATGVACGGHTPGEATRGGRPPGRGLGRIAAAEVPHRRFVSALLVAFRPPPAG
ncbi:MAG: ATP-binding protein [Kineosporiaceae bacterium]